MSRLLINPGRTEMGARGHFHDGDLVAAVDHLRDIDVLQVLGEAIVKRLETIDFAFEPVEFGEALA